MRKPAPNTGEGKTPELPRAVGASIPIGSNTDKPHISAICHNGAENKPAGRPAPQGLRLFSVLRYVSIEIGYRK